MRRKEYGYSFNINCIIISVTLVSILAMLVLYSPQARELDWTIFKSLKDFLSPYPQQISTFISSFGDVAHYLVWPLIAACCVLISHNKYLKAFLLVLFTQGAYFLNEFIKNYICRERPEHILHGFSFPSGHCAVEMCFLGILIYLITKYVTSKFWRYFLITLFSLWLILVGISRIWLGAHFPMDVIAGFFLGFLLVNIFIILDKALSRS